MRFTEKQLITLNNIVKALYETNLDFDISRKNYDIKVLKGNDDNDNIYLTFKHQFSGGEGIEVKTIFICILPDGERINMEEKHSIHELCNFFVTLKPFDF